MALHLVDPTKSHNYIIDIVPSRVDLELNPEIESILKATETNDEECQYLNERPASPTVQDVSEDLSKDKPQPRFVPFESTEEIKMDVTAANKWYSTLSPRNQVAFSVLVATICLTTCTKGSEYVCNHIQKLALIDFVKLYHRQPISGITIPPPSFAFISSVYFDFDRGSGGLQMILSRFLTVYKISKNNPESKPICGLLDLLILNKTSSNGLKLAFLAKEVAEKLNLELQEILDVISGQWPDLVESENLNEIAKFMEIASTNILWPWCRILNPRYHVELRIHKHFLSALVFGSIVWPNGDEPGWNMKALRGLKKYAHRTSEISQRVYKNLGK